MYNQSNYNQLDLIRMRLSLLKSLSIRLLKISLFSSLISLASLSSAQELTLDNIDSLLANSEASHSDLVEGTEKHVDWFARPGQKTPLSIIYLHGFSATHKELSPMTEMFAKQLGANVFYSRLTGHGRSDDAMSEATKEAWMADAKQAYEIGSLIGEKVILIGTSTGGTLSTWLMTQNFVEPNKLITNILISPNFAINGGGAWVLKSSMGMWFAKLVAGDYRGFTPQNEFHAKYWTERYPMEALQPMLALLDEVDELDKSKITVPQLLIYSPRDKVINVEKANETLDEMISAEVVKIPFKTSTDPAQHVLVGKGSTAKGDIQQQVDKMLRLLKGYLAGLGVNY